MLIFNHRILQKRIICVDKLEINDPILGEELISSLTRLAIAIIDLKPKVRRLFHPTSISIFDDRIYLQTSSLGLCLKMKDFDQVKSYVDDWILAAYKPQE